MATYNDFFLTWIYDRTDGRCHLCGRRLRFGHYGQLSTAGRTWEVEHSRPLAQGGTDRANNLYPACTACNRFKATRSTRSVRSLNGLTRAPLPPWRKNDVRASRAVVGGLVTASSLGLLGARPAAALAIGALAAVAAYHTDID